METGQATHESLVSLLRCGGLLRNSNGNCLNSYAHKISSCDTLHAEMWGMYIGIYGYGSETGDHTPTSGERLQSFGWHGNKKM